MRPCHVVVRCLYFRWQGYAKTVGRQEKTLLGKAAGCNDVKASVLCAYREAMLLAPCQSPPSALMRKTEVSMRCPSN